MRDLGTARSSSQPFCDLGTQDNFWVCDYEQPMVEYGEGSTSDWWIYNQNLRGLCISKPRQPVTMFEKGNTSDWLSFGQHVGVSETPYPELSQLSKVLSRILFSYSKEHKLDFATKQQWELLGEYATRIAGNPRVQLTNALRDLSEVVEEAKEEDYLVPNEIAVSNADRLLRKMYDILPLRYEVYPMPDGEVAIDAPTRLRSSVVVLCDSDGGALCLVNINGDSKRARYSTAESLPDGFIYEALNELSQQSTLTE